MSEKKEGKYYRKKEDEIDEMRKLRVIFVRRFPHIIFDMVFDLWFVIYRKNMWFRCICPVFSDFVNFEEYYIVEIGIGDETKATLNVETFVEIFNLFEKFETGSCS